MSRWFGRKNPARANAERMRHAIELADKHSVLAVENAAIAEDCTLAAKQHTEAEAHYRAIAARLSTPTEGKQQ